MPDPQPTPEWQPLGKLPLLAQHIDGWLATVTEQYATLQPARDRPSSLDDFTVGRVITVFTTQRDDLWLFEEQLRRWKAEQPTTGQRREIERLLGQMKRIRTVVNDVLALAEALKEATIEKMLAKGDLELGVETLLRWGRTGQDRSQQEHREP